MGIEAWRRLVQAPENAYRRYLLCDCVDAYLPLDDVQRREFEQLLLNEPDPGVRTMATTLFERIRQEGHQEGHQEGRLQGQRQFLPLQLAARFGPLRPRVHEIVGTWSEEQLAATGRALFSARSLQELGLEDGVS